MTERLVKELGLDRYGRMLQRAVGSECPVAFCDAAGQPLWASDGGPESRIRSALRGLDDTDCVFSDAPVQRIDLEAESLFCAAVGRDDGEPVGWLVTLADRELPDERRAAIADGLPDLALCIAREYRLSQEANALAQELSGRYEELNLMYSLEGHVRAFEEGVAGVEALLRNLTERIEVDLAAFVVSTRAEPIHAVKPMKAIENLDLVLTAIRGDLFRFVCTGGVALAINAPDDPRRSYLLANMRHRVVACPVLDLGSRAMLVLVRMEDRPEFTNGDRSLAKVIANQTAIMMQNHLMLGRLERFSEQMAQSLIEAIEAKDPYTRGHSERVQTISVAIGKAASLSGTTVEDISWGALLHDVGKIGIPDSIICKAGGLSNDEYTMIKTHPERSFEILRHVENLRRGAVDAARHHHERFDGGGYPSGLRGKAIPVEARVISIADTYDAVTSSRSYRPGSDHDSAMRVIREAAGSQLDDDLVRVFERACEATPEWIARSPAAPPESPDG